MAGVARVNGLGHAHEVLYSTTNLGFWTINCGATSADYDFSGAVATAGGQFIVSA